MRARHLYSVFLTLFILFLIVAGAAVTSTESSLAVPDWPLAYGQFFPPMVGGIFYEHGHRMVAGTAALLTFVLWVWTYRTEQSLWVRWVSFASVLCVFTQALLGGLTVLFLLPKPISIAHACLGQIYFCLVATYALITSSFWKNCSPDETPNPRLTFYALMLFLGFFVQLFLGAMLRHFKAGLAIPDFPLSFGRVIPPAWSFGVGIHYLHRLWGLCMMVGTIVLAVKFLAHASKAKVFTWGLIVGVCAQVLLGGWVVLSAKHPGVATAHVALGAFILMCSWVVFLIHSKTFGTLNLDLKSAISLGKPRIVLMVLMTTLTGYYLSVSTVNVLHAALTLLATALVAFGACAWNEILEVSIDEQMHRTQKRPLPSKKLSLSLAISLATVSTLIGWVLFFVFTNRATLFLSAITFASYIAIYTPLKKHSHLNTLVGAIPGALPPVMGFAAGRGTVTLEGYILFVILFLWQLPHFLAIALLFKEDYERAKLKMLPTLDTTNATGHHMFLYSAALVPAVAIPFVFQMSGIYYLVFSFLLSTIFCAMAYQFKVSSKQLDSKKMLLASVLYLPFILILMIVDKHP